MATSLNWMFILLLFTAAPTSPSASDHLEQRDVLMTVIHFEIYEQYKGTFLGFPIFWDSAFDDPDPMLSVTINGVERFTGYCENKYKCDCPGSCNMEWSNVPVSVSSWRYKIYDHDVSNHDLVFESMDIENLYHFSKSNDTRTRYSDALTTYDVVDRHTYKTCTSRTPINANCTGLYETSPVCYYQPAGSSAGSSSSCVTSCSLFYNPNGIKCDPVYCEKRVPYNSKCRSINDSVGDTCGSLNGKCLRCPSKHYTASTDGVCNLKTCSARVADASSSTPCNSSCNKQPNGSCNTGCPENYVEVTGVCRLKSCFERKAINGNAFPCEQNTCFQQLNPTGDGTHLPTCFPSCGGNLSVADRTSGRCELKEACGQRTPNFTHTAFPCGDSSCLRVVHDENPSGDCAPSCNPAHFIIESIPGHCHAKACKERGKIDGTDAPCGPGECYWDLGDTDVDNGTDQGKCSSSCTNDKHFKKQESNHTCILMECIERRENLTGSGEWPCGLRDEEPFGCYANTGRDKTNGGTDCATACSNSEHYELDSTSGRCVEKECENRTRNSSVTAPCGSGVCYLDGNAYAETNGSEAVNGQCRPSCMNPAHFAPVIAIGECMERECKFRTPNASETVPCGSGYCFADTGAGPNVCKDLQHADADNVTSNETNNETNDVLTNNETNDELTFDDACTHPTHYEAVEAKHRCILRKCEERKEDDKAVYFCGDQSCFLQPPGVDRACGQECPSHYQPFYRGETRGTCQLVDCPDTHTSDDSGVCVENPPSKKAKSNAASIIIPIVIAVTVVTVVVAAIAIVMIRRRHKRNRSGSGSGDQEDLDSGGGKNILFEDSEGEDGAAAGVDKGADAGAGASATKGVTMTWPNSCKVEADGTDHEEIVETAPCSGRSTGDGEVVLFDEFSPSGEGSSGVESTPTAALGMEASSGTGEAAGRERGGEKAWAESCKVEARGDNGSDDILHDEFSPASGSSGGLDSTNTTALGTETTNRANKASETPLSVSDSSKKFTSLTADEYQSIFGMTQEAFNKLPQWKQFNLRKTKNLF